MSDSDDDNLFSPPAKRKRPRKKKPDQSTLLDDFMAEDMLHDSKLDALRAQTTKSNERAKASGGLGVEEEDDSGLVVDWDYINKKKVEAAPMNYEDDDDDERLDEDVCGATLPARVRRVAARSVPVPNDGSLLCRVFSSLDEADLVEGLSQGYAARCSPSQEFVDWLHSTVAFDGRDGVARAAAATLRLLNDRRTTSTDNEVQRKILGEYLGRGGEPADEETARRLVRYVNMLAACCEPGVEFLDAAFEIAADRAVSKIPNGRRAARALAEAALRSNEKAPLEKTKSPFDRGGGDKKFSLETAARTVVALRTLPHSSLSSRLEARRRAAEAASKILVEDILKGTEIRRVEVETPKIEEVRPEYQFIAENLRLLVAALVTVERDAGGGSSREPILGSHHRFYAAIVAIFALHCQIKPDLTHLHHSLLLEPADKLKMRIRSELDPNANRVHDFFDIIHGSIARAAQPPQNKQATILDHVGAVPASG